jgi:hypothetical protein
MKTIHKYELAGVVTPISTYEGVRFLHVDTQRERITVWAEVNTLDRECLRTLHLVPTGGDVPRQATYVGSVLIDEGTFVFHVYVEERQ